MVLTSAFDVYVLPSTFFVSMKPHICHLSTADPRDSTEKNILGTMISLS